MGEGAVVIVGGGLFGLTTAVALVKRGREVSLLDPGPLPHPDAASTDVSKVVRVDYGRDLLYTELMERALERWQAWNRAWGETLFHEDGLLMLTASPMEPEGFEHDCFETLRARGHALERLDGAAVAGRFPAWRPGAYVDGYLNPRGGWVESGAVIARLVRQAERAGVRFVTGRFARLAEAGSRVTGVVTTDGGRHAAATVVLAAGAWTPAIDERLGALLKAVGQPVFHFRPERAAAFRHPHFLTWCADVARTGWYGFPALADGTVKVANHGPGRPVSPDAARRVLPEDEERFRAFLATTFPALADAPVAATRLCLYGDTADGNFLIDRDPERPGLVVAAGGSGHAFKFAPVLGDIVADVVEGRPDPFHGRFAWRTGKGHGTDAARHAQE